MSFRKLLADSRCYVAAAAVALLLLSNAQTVSARQQGSSEGTSPRREAPPDLQPQPSSEKTLPESSQDDDGKQSKRILGIFPNYRAVSANTQLPPLSLREKFWLATQDSFDYSSFISARIISGVSQANNSYRNLDTAAKHLAAIIGMG